MKYESMPSQYFTTSKEIWHPLVPMRGSISLNTFLVLLFPGAFTILRPFGPYFEDLLYGSFGYI